MNPREDDPEFAERRPTFDDLRADYDDEFGHPQTPWERARRRVRVPAIALIVIGCIGTLGGAGLATWWLIQLVNHASQHGPDEVFIVALMEASFLVGVAVFALVLAGGFSILRLRRHWLGLFAAYVVTGLSLAGCYAILFYPFGIWALIVLYRPDVREQFGRRPAAPERDDKDW